MAYILIVDDDEELAEAIAIVLDSDGHEVRIQLDSNEALPDMEQRRPDLLILDVMFPEDNTAGFDLARAIRQRDALAHMPILMLTAVNTKFPLGFGPQDIDDDWIPVTDFIAKPVDLDVLKERVNAILAAAT